MFHIVYASSASETFTKDDLQTLLQRARNTNTSLGLTGMLLYKGGNFMQVLEGEQEAVMKMVKTIERDSRHRGFMIFLRGTSEQRLFPDWSMGFRDLADLAAAKPAGYSDFMNAPLNGVEFSENPNRCMKLLLSFKRNM